MKQNCQYYEECRLPVQKCNSKCKKFKLADWVKKGGK